MGKKLMNKTRKELQIVISESADSTKPIKESRKLKDKGVKEVNVDKRVDKDKVLETVSELYFDSDTDTKVTDVTVVKTLVNVKVIATEDYIAQNRDELTLKVGKKIKQKIPANSDGMAYGWIRKGKLRKKIYGYYPANLVELEAKKKKTGIRGMLSKERQILKSEF
ncbi:hypothetical protein CHS0354_025665 [Potamilus streckersoni]|uniref:Uncharacterized protein n=1 Tax=Potamilus streckersoni TaxID=2493646 RepID=A0AAE0VKW6_9BIVA|nr:hypothetical protein CHS0354_025665 [Potamilus streckersoni]